MAVGAPLKFLVLKVLLLSEKMNGSRILRSIEEKTGWRASPGSFYPVMQELIDLEMVEFSRKANIKIYSVTEKGRDFLKEADSKREEIFKKIGEGIKFLRVLGEEKHIENIGKRLGDKDLEFLPIHNSITDIQKVLIDLDIKKHSNDISEILSEAVKKLEKLR